jgi:hypothetical protein
MVFSRYRPLLFQYNTFWNHSSSDHICQLDFHTIFTHSSFQTCTRWQLTLVPKFANTYSL